ncbi:phosphatidylinositol transfer protein csr1 [Rhizina undulata]
MLGRPFKPTKSIASGRPETLTVEEEAKLKRLWHAALKVFAVAGPDPEETPSATSSTSGSPVSGPASPTSPDDKRRKSHSLGRFFHRREEKEAKKQEASTPPTPKSETLATSAGDDDKYGSKQDFLAALASQTPEELRTAFWMMVKCDNPDGLLLRFLRARKWDVDKALVMMISTMSWRLKQMDVEKLMETGDEGAIIAGDEGFMKQLRMGKSYLHGVDIEGRPICYVRVRLHNKADQSEQSLERYTVYIMETARLMLSPPVDTAAVVFDMTGFSLANMDYAPVKFMIKCFEAHYPESLGICLVHKAPWVFRGIWNIIKGWLDPVVATKIHFTESLEDMEAFIPRSQILAELGGDEAWSYTYDEPVPGENAPLKDTARREKLQKERDELVLEYEEQTRRWVVEREEVAAGRIKDQRNAIAGKIKAGYWGLDKHVRARTIYDRRGVLGPNGELNFYGDRGRVGGKVETSEEDID